MKAKLKVYGIKTVIYDSKKEIEITLDSRT